MSIGKPSGAGFALVLSGAARLFCALIFFTAVQPSGAATRSWDDNDKDADWSIWDLGNAPAKSASAELIFSGTNDTRVALTPVNQDIASPFQLNTLAFSSGGRFFLADGDTAVSGVGTTMRNTTVGTDVITSTTTWNGGGGNNNWSNGANWGGTAPVANDSLSFGGTIQLATNNDIAANTIFAGITFNSLAGAFALSGNRITLGGDVVNNSTSLQTISLAMILSATRTFTTLAGGGDLSIGGILSGAGGLTKTGTGTLTLSGANTYNGATSISAGVLNIQNAASLGATGTGTTVSSGATLQLQGSITVGNEALTISGIGASGQTGALVNVSGTNTYGGLLTLTGATIFSSDSGMLNLNNGTITGATFGLTLAGAGDGSITSIIGTTSGSLTKTGTGTWSLLGANTYTGATTVSAGVLNIQNATGLGTIAAGTTVSSGATLQLQGGITVGAETLNINGTGAGGQSGALVNVSGTNTYGGLLTLAGATTLSSDSGILNLTNAGTITGATFGLTLAGAGNGSISSIIGTTSGSLTKTGTGTWSLLGVNTYTGGTTINGGTLVVNSASSLGNLSGGLTINAGTLEVSAGFTTTRAITVSDAASTFQIDASQTFTDSTAISGSGNLNKTGAGAMVLGVANTYTGATNITAGVLNIQSATGLGTTAGGTTVSSGATLQLQGGINVGTETLNINGTGAGGQTGALVNVSGTNNYDGLFTLAGATTLSSDSGTLNLTNAGTITGATFGLTLAGAGNGSISSIIGTTSGSLIKNGAGTWSLLGVNTYTGGTTINGGTLVVNSASSLGNLSGGLTINAGTLEVSTGFSTTRAITLGNAASTFQIDASQIFTDTTAIGGTGGLNKTGAGTMVLGGANTYAGATTITTGVLNIQNATALGTIVGDTTVSNGAALQIQGGITIGAEVLTLNGSGIANDGALRNISSANSMSGAITLGSATTISSDSGTLTLSGAFDNGGFLLTVGGAGDVTTSGVISGIGGLTKTGSGTLTLSGTVNNTYSGLTTVNDGTLQLNMTPTKNASAGNFTVGDGTGAASSAVMRWLGSNQIPNKVVIINTDGLADLGTFSDTIGALTMTGGSVTSTTGILILGGNLTGNASSSSATISGNLDFGNSNRTFSIADGGAAIDMLISGVLSGTHNLIKDGNGTLELSGANTYTGTTTISAGIVNIQNNTALGTTAAGTTVSSGATLQLQGGITIGSEALSVNGAGAAGQTGAVVNVGGTNNYGGLLTLTGATTLSSDSGTLNLTNTGIIAGNNFALTLAGAGNGSISSIIGTTGGSLTKNGAGTWSLLGVNTYTGGTTINGGTLVVNNASSLGNLSGGLTINAGTLEVSAGFTTTRAITLGDVASTFQIDTSQTFTDSTAISGTGNLNKTGAGTMVLGATETYTGSTNVTAGTLQISASNRIVDTSALTVSGGNFDVQSFSETVAAVTLSGGSITGTGAGTLTGSSYALQSGSASAILAGGGAVNKTTAGTVTLTGANTLTGAVTVSGGTLTLAATSGSALGAVASIAVNSGGTLLLGASNQINNAATMSLGGGTFASGGFSEGSAGTGGTSTLGLGALTLTAANSHLDFGTGAVGTLSFTSLTAGGFTLTIDNWTGTLNTIGTGSTDRLIFNSDQSSNLNSFQFTGFGPGAVEFSLGGGYWEITPAVVAPEPATYFTAALTFAAACFHQRRRIRGLFLRRIAT